MNIRCFSLLALVVSVGIAIRYDGCNWRATRSSPATTVSVAQPQQSRVIGEARVTARPGYDLLIGADFAGIVAHVFVKEGDEVRAGGRLADFDASVQLAALAGADARIREVSATLKLAEPRARRGEALLKNNALSQEVRDERHTDLEVARAQLQVSQAEVERLRADIAHSVINAPIAGTVIERIAEPGMFYNRGAPLFRLTDVSRLWLTADIDEFSADSVAVGDTARIIVEGYPGKEWQGRVEEIPLSVTKRQIDPANPAAPTDVGVVRVKVALPPDHPLRLGQRVELEIATGSSSPQ